MSHPTCTGVEVAYEVITWPQAELIFDPAAIERKLWTRG